MSSASSAAASALSLLALLVLLVPPHQCDITGVYDLMWKTDMYHRFLDVHRKQRDMVAPCDNFFRHVCPNDTFMHFLFDRKATMTPEFIQALHHMFLLRDDIDFYVSDTCNANYNGIHKIFIHTLNISDGGDAEGIRKTISYLLTHETFPRSEEDKANVTKTRFALDILPYIDDYDQLVSALEAAFKAYNYWPPQEVKSQRNLFKEHERKPYHCGAYRNLLVRQMATTMLFHNKTAMEKYIKDRKSMISQVSNKFMQEIRRFRWAHDQSRFGLTAAELSFIFIRQLNSLLDFDEADLRGLDELTRIIHTLNAKYHATVRPVSAIQMHNITDDEFGNIFGEESVEAFKGIMALVGELEKHMESDPARAMRWKDFNADVAYFARPNLENKLLKIVMPHPWTFHSYFGASEAVQYGSIYSIYAHEMGHLMQHVYRDFVEANDFYTVHRKDCLGTYTETFCESDSTFMDLYGCESGKRTYDEDDADISGMRVAYEVFEKDFGEKRLKEFAYPDLNITNQQLFFYAYAMKHCKNDPYDFKTLDHDAHSPFHFRPNFIFASMNEFSEAFQCPAGTNMHWKKNFFLDKSGNNTYPKAQNPEQCDPEISGYSYFYDNYTIGKLPYTPVEKHDQKDLLQTPKPRKMAKSQLKT